MVISKKDTTPKEIALFKNHLTKIVFQIGKYKGKERLDVRQWVALEGANNQVEKWIPTKSGISISKELIPEFKDLVSKIKDS